MKDKIAYYVRETLRHAGAVDQGPDEDVDTLIVADDIIICEWSDEYSQAGNYFNRLRPAFYQGKKCFLHTRYWEAGNGYSAEGIDDYIIDIKEGIVYRS